MQIVASGTAIGAAQWMVVALGVALAVMGVAGRVAELRLRNRWTRTTGVVLDVRSGEPATALIEFTDLAGRPVRVVQVSSDSARLRRRGQPALVWYDPADPRRFTARAGERSTSWLLLVLVGGVLIVIGMAVGAS